MGQALTFSVLGSPSQLVMGQAFTLAVLMSPWDACVTHRLLQQFIPVCGISKDREHSADIGWLCQFYVESLLWQAFTGSDGTYVASNKWRALPPVLHGTILICHGNVTDKLARVGPHPPFAPRTRN
jgi:hypothetical protein